MLCKTIVIWPGVASYLKIVSDYVQQYRGTPLDLPTSVLESAKVGGDETYVESRFIRVPLMPYGAALYRQELASIFRSGNVPATFRLSLLPPLAMTAAMAFRLTGNDKGIW